MKYKFIANLLVIICITFFNILFANTTIEENDDFFTFEVTEIEQSINDPYEKFNRALYSFYIGLYPYTFKYIVPIYAYKGPYLGSRLNDFKENLSEPRNIVNHILQLRINAAAESGFRFIINSTVGLLGFFDIMDYLGMPYKANDFGATLYFYNVPDGPYIIIIGPFSLRDTVGLIANFGLSFTSVTTDLAFSNLNSLDNTTYSNNLSWFGSGIVILDAALVYDSFSFSLQQSLDEYSFIKNSMMTIRKEQLRKISEYK